MTESGRWSAKDDRATAGVRTYMTIWLGQIVSLLGSGLSGFGIGVWAFQRSGSVTEYSLLFLWASLPAIILSPLAGALVDRWNHRWVMILADTVVATATLLLLVLVSIGGLELWQIYLFNILASAAESFQAPALAAATTLLVPKRHLARAAGAMQAGFGLVQIGAPLLAGVLIGLLGLRRLLMLDLATFGFALATLLFVRIPRPPVSVAGRAAHGTLLAETLYGWRHLRQHPGLMALLAFFACSNFSNGMALVLFTPLVLSFSTTEVLGRVLSVVGLGILAGSVFIVAWGGPRRRVPAIFLFAALANSVLLLGGMKPSAVGAGVAGFIFIFTGPVSNALSQAVWQQKVEPDLQGRVFATRRVVATLTLPLAYLVSGRLADRVFEPLMAEGGALAEVLGPYIGVGPGRGIGLMFMTLGLSTLSILVLFWLNPRLRNLEDEIPEATAEVPSPCEAAERGPRDPGGRAAISLPVQSDHRMDGNRPQGGHEAGHESGQEQSRQSREENPEIEGFHLEQQLGDHLADRQ
jgi:DHA3 family macrolide efflux protein-like MFS transporter